MTSRSERRRGGAGAALLVLVSALLALAGCQAPHSPPSAARPTAGEPLLIDFLDVGQGDGVLLQAPGGPTVLVDGGRPGGRAVEQLQNLGITQLDLLLATHADYDHTGVHEHLLDALGVRVYIHNGLPHATRSQSRILDKLEGLVGEGRTRVFSAASFATGHDLGRGGVGLHLLPPPPELATAGAQNQQSIGLIVTRGDFKAVLVGDAEGPQLEAWLADSEVRALIQGADVYKASHHGAADADPAVPGWLERIRPSLVVIPVGRNTYGHPAREALSLYRTYTDAVVRTDVEAGVRIRVAADGTWSRSVRDRSAGGPPDGGN